MTPGDKYLTRYAEPETRLARFVPGDYGRVLVVPAYRESASMLDGYLVAASGAPRKTLGVVVVNAPAGPGGQPSDAGSAADNAGLMDALGERMSDSRLLDPGDPTQPRARLGAVSEAMDLLVVDRSTPPHGVPKGEGVGLARKIGCDLALALVAQKKAGPWIFCTDADARLDETHFTAAEARFEGSRPAALVYPFWHEPSEDPALTRAFALYEIRLRYYVAGLAWAGSPYAMHTLGSLLAIDANAYAVVRGFPRRAAAEDFYLLGKLAKIGWVVSLRRPCVHLRARRSSRTPFGTGRGVAALEEQGALRLYAPESFRVLRAWLAALDAFCDHRSPPRVLEGIRAACSSDAAATVERWAEGGDALARLDALAGQAPDRFSLERGVHTWFDAFRTLKLIHALRDGAFGDVFWRDAVARAPFVPPAKLDDRDAALTELRRALAEVPLPRAGLYA